MTRISPHVLMNGAEEFFKAAGRVSKPPISVRDKLGHRANLTAYYLLAHSIELSLKAFLLGRGVKYNKLRYKPYGHDLDRLISDARKRKLGNEVKLSENEVRLIKLLSISYCAKLLEYTETGYYKLPEYGVLHEIAGRLVKGIRPFAHKKTFN